MASPSHSSSITTETAALSLLQPRGRLLSARRGRKTTNKNSNSQSQSSSIQTNPHVDGSLKTTTALPSSSSLSLESKYHYYWVRPLGAPDSCRRLTVRPIHHSPTKNKTTTRKSKITPAVWSRALSLGQLQEHIHNNDIATTTPLTRLELDGAWRKGLPLSLFFAAGTPQQPQRTSFSTTIRTLVLCSPGWDDDNENNENDDDDSTTNNNATSSAPLSLPILLQEVFLLPNVTRLAFHGSHTLSFRDLTYLASSKSMQHATNATTSADGWLESILWDGAPIYWDNHHQHASGEETRTATNTKTAADADQTTNEEAEGDNDHSNETKPSKENEKEVDPKEEERRRHMIAQAWIHLLETHQQSLRRLVILADHQSVFDTHSSWWIPFLQSLTRMAVLQECRVAHLLERDEPTNDIPRTTSTNKDKVVEYVHFLNHVHTIRALWQGDTKEAHDDDSRSMVSNWPRRRGAGHDGYSNIASQAMGVLETWYRDSHMPAILVPKSSNANETERNHETNDLTNQQGQQHQQHEPNVEGQEGEDRRAADDGPPGENNNPPTAAANIENAANAWRNATINNALSAQPQQQPLHTASCWNRPRTLAERLAAASSNNTANEPMAPPRPALSEWVMPATRRQEQRQQAMAHTTFVSNTVRQPPRTLAELAGSLPLSSD